MSRFRPVTRKKSPDILRDRENRLGQYITIVEYSQKIDERRRSIEIQQKKYDQASGQFKESYAAGSSRR